MLFRLFIVELICSTVTIIDSGVLTTESALAIVGLRCGRIIACSYLTLLFVASFTASRGDIAGRLSRAVNAAICCFSYASFIEVGF